MSDNESENVTDDEQEPTSSNTSVLKENVASYIKIDDLIAEKRAEIKELSEKKIKYEDYIKKYLEKENKEKIELSDGSIVFKKTSVKQPLKEEIIEKAIISKIKTFNGKKISGEYEKIAHEIVNDMDSMRGINIKSSIKRTGKKKTNK